MSDNVLLTLLGAVGIGALVMGMNQEEVKEDWWAGINFRAEKKRVQVTTDENGRILHEQQLDGPDIDQGMQELQRVNVQQTMTNLQSVQSVSFGDNDTKENFEHYSPSLGSGTMTGNHYVSYPDYQQTVNQPSPSLGLPAIIRYNMPSDDKIGITSNFRGPTVVEGWQSQDRNNPNPGQGYSAGNYNELVGEVHHKNGELNVSSKELGVKTGQLGENVMIFDRYMTVPGKSAGRFNRGNGIVDRIRGDLPVCVDPCQKGWFASPGNPAQLTVGALGVIGGGGEQANAIANFTKLYGTDYAQLPSSGALNAQQNIIGSTQAQNGTVMTSGFH